MEKNMRKRTIGEVGSSIKVQRHYVLNGILMSREQKKLIVLPVGTMVEILKVRRQSHLCSVRCIENEDGLRILGNGRKAVDTCIAIPVDYLPKMKIPGVEAKAKGKGTKTKGTKGSALPVVQVEALPLSDLAQGIGQADIAPQAPDAVPAPVEVAPAVEAPAPVEAAPAAVEAAV
jgi:hypothetical protein